MRRRKSNSPAAGATSPDAARDCTIADQDLRLHCAWQMHEMHSPARLMRWRAEVGCATLGACQAPNTVSICSMIWQRRKISHHDEQRFSGEVMLAVEIREVIAGKPASCSSLGAK